MAYELFAELGIILLITVVVSLFARLLRQPLIIGYILSGILAGPLVFDVVRSENSIVTFSHIGIAFLLFTVGLNLNPQVVRKVGRAALITGVGQVLFTSLIGFALTVWLGFGLVAAAYIAVAITFSSTIIIMKLLSDKHELDSLHGRIAIGFLIVQDVVAILILIGVSSFDAAAPVAIVVASAFVKLVVIGFALWVVARYVLPLVTLRIARSQELLLLFSIAWCFLVAMVFAWANFSIEAGALLAGVALSVSAYNLEISSRIRPLRDFFIVLFFIVLGAQMTFSDIGLYIIPSIVLSVFILVGNPLVVLLLMKRLGYTARTSFKAGLAVAQISEFSLILIALGISKGHIEGAVLSLVTVVGIITIAVSSYMILYSDQIFRLLYPLLSPFHFKKDVGPIRRRRKYDLLIFGYDRIGFEVLESLSRMKKSFLVVDFNPEIVELLKRRGFECVYGDANDVELLNDLNLEKVKMVLSTIPDVDTNALLMRQIKAVNPRAIIVAEGRHVEDAFELYRLGASYVSLPHFLGGHHVMNMIKQYRFDDKKYAKKKQAHIREMTNITKYFNS